MSLFEVILHTAESYILMLKYGYNTARSKGKDKKFKKKVLANAADLKCEMLMFSRGGKGELSGWAFQQGCVCTGRGLK